MYILSSVVFCLQDIFSLQDIFPLQFIFPLQYVSCLQDISCLQYIFCLQDVSGLQDIYCFYFQFFRLLAGEELCLGMGRDSEENSIGGVKSGGRQALHFTVQLISS